MGMAEVRDDGSIYFAAGIDSAKVDELEKDPQAGAFFQGTGKWVSLSGRLTVSRDRALIDRLWKDSWKLWFPNGKDDPRLCILLFDPSEGEYWDNTGLTGVQFFVEAAKAYLQGPGLSR